MRLPWGNTHPLRLGYIFKYVYKHGNIISTSTIFPYSSDTISMLSPVTLKWDTIVRVVKEGKSTVYYDYFANKLNTTNGNTNSKNLIKRSVEIASSGDTDMVNNYRYTFDRNNRVISEVFESAPGYKDGNTTQLEYDSIAYTYY